MMMRKLLPLLLGASALSACATVPAYTPPAAPQAAAGPFPVSYTHLTLPTKA